MFWAAGFRSIQESRGSHDARTGETPSPRHHHYGCLLFCYAFNLVRHYGLLSFNISVIINIRLFLVNIDFYIHFITQLVLTNQPALVTLGDIHR